MKLEVHPAGPSATKSRTSIKRGMVVGFGLLAVAYVGLATASGEVPYIVLAVLYLLVFCVNLRKYKRSRRIV